MKPWTTHSNQITSNPSFFMSGKIQFEYSNSFENKKFCLRARKGFKISFLFKSFLINFSVNVYNSLKNVTKKVSSIIWMASRETKVIWKSKSIIFHNIRLDYESSLTSSRDGTFVLGYSLGGLFSCYAAWTCPNVRNTIIYSYFKT